MNENKRYTKRDKINVLAEIVRYAETNGVVVAGFEDLTYENLYDFLNHELELMDKRNAAATNRTNARKAAGEATQERIIEVLTGDFKTVQEIQDALNDPTVSYHMIANRLGKLAKDEDSGIEKTTITYAGTEGTRSRRLTAYRKV